MIMVWSGELLNMQLPGLSVMPAFLRLVNIAWVENKIWSANKPELICSICNKLHLQYRDTNLTSLPLILKSLEKYMFWHYFRIRTLTMLKFLLLKNQTPCSQWYHDTTFISLNTPRCRLLIYIYIRKRRHSDSQHISNKRNIFWKLMQIPNIWISRQIKAL